MNSLIFEDTFFILKQEVLGRINRLLSLKRHGPHWKRRVQQFFYCYVHIRYRGNVSTEPSPSNDRRNFTEPLPSNDKGHARTQTVTWSHKLTSFFQIRKVGLWDHVAVCLCILSFKLLNAWTNLYETWNVYHSTWALLNGRIKKIPPISLCLCMCILLSFLGNGSVKKPIDPRQRLGRNFTALLNTHATIEELLEASFSMWLLVLPRTCIPEEW
jgi:hypothetical protein